LTSYPSTSTNPTNPILSKTQLMLHPIGFIINLMSWLEVKLFFHKLMPFGQLHLLSRFFRLLNFNFEGGSWRRSKFKFDGCAGRMSKKSAFIL